MKFNFLSTSLPAFGFDIGGNDFKIMLLGKSGKQFSVRGYHNTLLPKNLIVNDEIADVKTFAYLIEQALAKPQFGRIDTKYAAVSLPESKSFVRVVQIPQMSEAEAENAVPYEAESFIPLPIDQVYLDWQVIGNVGDKMNILMVASPRAFVDKYLEVLDKVGIKPVALEVESQSCVRAIIAAKSNETCLVVDLNASRSSLIMVEEGNLQFTSTIPIAGNTFTESIARTLGVGSNKAEEIKKLVGIASTAEYPNIKISLLPVLNNLSAEIKNILKFHAEHSDKQVTKVILSGGGSKLKNLGEFLAVELRESGVSEVILANPWQNLPLLANPPLDSLESLGFTTAIGLGLRGINFKVN